MISANPSEENGRCLLDSSATELTRCAVAIVPGPRRAVPSVGNRQGPGIPVSAFLSSSRSPSVTDYIYCLDK